MSDNITVTGQEAWFNEDAKFFKDVYVYGNLYYDLEGFDTLKLDSITVNQQANFKNVNISGIVTLTDISIRNLFATGIATVQGKGWFEDEVTFREEVFINKEIENLQVGILTVTEYFRIKNGTNEYFSAPATGLRAGNVGINSTAPVQKLDIGGAVHIQTNIFDSVNYPGISGQYLSRDATGIRWVEGPPDSQVDGFYAQNEGVNIGVGSFSTINLIGTRSGGDIVFGTDAGSGVLDVDIRSYWLSTNAGIHTTRNVGINVASPTVPLDVDGNAKFRQDVDVDGVLYANDVLDVDGAATLRTTLNVKGDGDFDQDLNVDGNIQVDQTATIDGATTLNSTLDVESSTFIDAGLIVSGFTTGTISTAQYSVIAGFATNSHRAGFATYADYAGISTLSVISGFATNAHRAGFATYSDRAGIVTFATDAGYALTAGISTFARTAGIGTTAMEIYTTATNTNQYFFLPFVENSTSTEGEILRVDPGIRYNPAFDGVNIAGILTVGSATTIHSTLDVDDKTTLKDNLEVDGNSVFDGSVELNSTLIDINGQVAGPGVGLTDYRLSSVGTGVSWRPAGVQTKNILYVTKDGKDTNSGLLEGDAKATIGGACEAALDGDTIYVRPGVYYENNPVGLRTDVSISGQDLRLVTVVPNNPNDDVFHVRRGCLVENLNFAGDPNYRDHTGCGALAFPPIQADITDGSAQATRTGYVGPGPINEGPSGRYRSPYIRNCTNFMTGSIGLKIDGRYADAAYTGTNNLGQDLRSMVCDSFTQYNENGIGVSVTNKAYAQLVSIFTINSRIGIFAGSGGQCDLTNSNSSFGEFGLYADGTSITEFTGITTGGTATAESDKFPIQNVKDTDNNFRKPFDGQSAFFKINLDDYADVSGVTGIITAPMRTIRSITVTNGGSGYSDSAPPNVVVTTPQGPEGIRAELSANVSAAGTVTSIDVIASGRNFLPHQPIDISIGGSGGAVAIAVTDPILYTVSEATEPSDTLGISTVTFNEFIPYSIAQGTDIEFRRISRIITSSHSFEYVGAGTDINRANPFQGGAPIPENEIVAINGGQVPFTSTDQKGNFRIGSGLTIDQTTSTISGRDFNRAIQANLTPLILALGG